MERLFLDANVLFSAAYREDAGVRKLWGLSAEAELVSSSYAIGEATRNLSTPEQHARLQRLLKEVRVSNTSAPAATQAEIEAAGLPEKDVPIMEAAVGSRCTHLITGDRRHFGHLHGKKVAGVLVSRPADHLAQADR